MKVDEESKITNPESPRHIAIIMDGNGRWAQKKHLPRPFGHRAGVKTVRKIVDYCARKDIEVLSLFAFSSENWKRPKEEVSMLMDLFFTLMQSEVKKLHKNNVRLRFIGDRNAFSQKLQTKISEGEMLTKDNTGLTLVIAANYGGHWDVKQAIRKMLDESAQQGIYPEDSDAFVKYLSIFDLPDPDLFIRTGGEKRISNFLLWQLAYTELYFTPELWPDFNQASLDKALTDYSTRERRFGHTSAQIENRTVSS
jgi:undecaprenyl diphosphate synthase